MQFKRKLKNQTSENSEKRNFGPDFGPNSGPPNFFRGFYLYLMLDIVASYHCIQSQGKLMNQTCENCKKKLISGLIWLVWPKFGLQKLFSWILPLLDARHCWKLSLYEVSRKTNHPNSRKWRKTSFWAGFRPVGSKFGPQIFFFFFSKIWLRQSLDIMVSYHHVQYQKKLMIQS